MAYARADEARRLTEALELPVHDPILTEVPGLTAPHDDPAQNEAAARDAITNILGIAEEKERQCHAVVEDLDAIVTDHRNASKKRFWSYIAAGAVGATLIGAAWLNSWFTSPEPQPQPAVVEQAKDVRKYSGLDLFHIDAVVDGKKLPLEQAQGKNYSTCDLVVTADSLGRKGPNIRVPIERKALETGLEVVRLAQANDESNGRLPDFIYTPEHYKEAFEALAGKTDGEYNVITLEMARERLDAVQKSGKGLEKLIELTPTPHSNDSAGGSEEVKPQPDKQTMYKATASVPFANMGAHSQAVRYLNALGEYREKNGQTFTTAEQGFILEQLAGEDGIVQSTEVRAQLTELEKKAGKITTPYTVENDKPFTTSYKSTLYETMSKSLNELKSTYQPGDAGWVYLLEKNSNKNGINTAQLEADLKQHYGGKK